MQSIKRLLALCLMLMILMSSAACADVPFLVHSQGWKLDGVPMEVLLKADVEAHLPFDKDRLAMLTPITDLLSLRLVTGEDEGSVTVAIGEEDALSLQYRGNEMQLSCMPHVTYTAAEDPLGALLGAEVASGGGYEALHLSPQGESLLDDGKALLAAIPAAFEEQGRKTKTDTTISGYGKSSYRIDYSIAATKVEAMQETLLSICPEGWLKEIISGLSFSGKQALRVYYTAQDEIVRIEYNGICGPEGDLRTVKLVGRFRDDEETQKDYIELTSPAKKGKDKNNLTFERVYETNKKGARVVRGTYKYTATKEGVTSTWSGEFNLSNAFTNGADVITGEATFQSKLNGAERNDAITFAPNLTISGSPDEPTVEGTLSIIQKSGSKVAEQAVISLALKRAEPIVWENRDHIVDLSAMDSDILAAVRQEAANAIATSLVRPLINRMGKDAEWFFREMPADAVQSIIDAAASADQ